MRHLDIALIGAGIAGLTAARALQLAGFRVRVYEQAPQLGEVGAGLTVSPNATHVLNAIGLGETWVFDLRATRKPLVVAGMDLAGDWPASYFSIAGPDEEAIAEANLVITGNFKRYALPQNARQSPLIEKVNPTVLFLSLVGGVIASLVVDVIVVATSRMPYASDVKLPQAPTDD